MSGLEVGGTPKECISYIPGDGGEEHKADELEAFYICRLGSRTLSDTRKGNSWSRSESGRGISTLLPLQFFFQLRRYIFTGVKTEIGSTKILLSWSSIKATSRSGFGCLNVTDSWLRSTLQSPLYLKLLVRRASPSLWTFPWCVEFEIRFLLSMLWWNRRGGWWTSLKREKWQQLWIWQPV